MPNAPDIPPPVNRSVLLAGASGLVGRCLLQGLLNDPSVACVHSLARGEVKLQHPKLVSHVVSFAALPPLPAVDEVYLAVGTTIRQAGSQQAFRAVDFGINLAVAQAAVAAGARRIGLVSALGADAHSRTFYSRVKGELEDALSALPLAALVVAQPSLLLGDRDALGQPTRRMEQLATFITTLLGPLLPLKIRPIAAQSVARALLSRTPTAQGKVILPSAEMQVFRQ